MSQHTIVGPDNSKFVFGWDQPLMSFFLQVHDTERKKDDQIVLNLGSTKDTIMYDVEDLVWSARKLGCDIPYGTQLELHKERDEGI